MADDERPQNRNKKKVKCNEKSRLRWRKPANLSRTGNKEKGHAFAETRKKIAIREYKKLVKKTRVEHKQRVSSEMIQVNEVNSSNIPGVLSQEKSDHQRSLGKERKTSHGPKRKPVSRFTTAQNNFKKRKLEKELQKKEREESIQKHKEEVRQKMNKRRETFSRLNQRTRKGQPVMASQIEHLLERIQSQN